MEKGVRLIIFIIGLAIAGAINPEYMSIEGVSDSSIGALTIIMIYPIILDVAKKS